MRSGKCWATSSKPCSPLEACRARQPNASSILLVARQTFSSSSMTSTEHWPPPRCCSSDQRRRASLRNRQSLPTLKHGIAPRLASLRTVCSWALRKLAASLMFKTSDSRVTTEIPLPPHVGASGAEACNEGIPDFQRLTALRRPSRSLRSAQPGSARLSSAQLGSAQVHPMEMPSQARPTALPAGQGADRPRECSPHRSSRSAKAARGADRPGR